MKIQCDVLLDLHDDNAQRQSNTKQQSHVKKKMKDEGSFNVFQVGCKLTQT